MITELNMFFSGIDDTLYILYHRSVRSYRQYVFSRFIFFYSINRSIWHKKKHILFQLTTFKRSYVFTDILSVLKYVMPYEVLHT